MRKLPGISFNQINKQIRNFSSTVLREESTHCVKDRQNGLINPGFLTGFTDGDGCFYLAIVKNKKLKTGWDIQLVFQIHLHTKDLFLLNQIKTYLGVGRIDILKSSVIFRVQAIKDLAKIIEHFDKHPLMTQKLADYLLFKKVYSLVLNKKHLTTEGLQEIVSIKSAINLGLSEELKASFQDSIIPVERPIIVDQKIADPY